jgi:hypothetical protein
MGDFEKQMEKIFGKTLEEMRSEIKEELVNNKEEVIEKLDYVLELLKKEKEKQNVNKENNKDRINKAFEKKQIGRPIGSWQEKGSNTLNGLLRVKSLNRKKTH